MAAGLVDFTKAALLEIQEYVRMLGKVCRGLTSGPYYYRDIIEQFEAIGVGSLTVVLLTVIASGVGMVGGWIVTSTLLRVASSIYWNAVVQGLYICLLYTSDAADD